MCGSFWGPSRVPSVKSPHLVLGTQDARGPREGCGTPTGFPDWTPDKVTNIRHVSLLPGGDRDPVVDTSALVGLHEAGQMSFSRTFKTGRGVLRYLVKQGNF